MPGQESELKRLVSLSWTYRGPLEVKEEGDVWWEIRIKELPDFFVAGRDGEEALQELRPALTAFLSSYLESGDAVPIPSRRWLMFLSEGGARAVEEALVQELEDDPPPMTADLVIA